MNIPEEAIKAAAWTLYGTALDDASPSGLEDLMNEARAAIEAAAPFIAAQAIREVADSIDSESPFHSYDDTLAHWRIAGRWARIIRKRATDIEGQK